MAILTALQELPISREVVAGTLVVMALAYIVNTVVVWRRLSHFPGLWWAGLSNWGFFSDALKLRQPTAMMEYHDRYGTLVRVGPGTVFTDDPEIVYRITAVRGRYTRAKWYQALRLDPDRDSVVNVIDDNLHTAMRRKMAPGFRPMDFALTAQYFTSDVISELAFGKGFGNCDADADVKGYLVKWPFRPFFYSEDMALGPVVRIARDVVMERFGPAADKTKAQKRDMLASFICNGIQPEQAIGESVLQLSAGADTPATCIRVAILHLISNNVAYRRLQAEIDRCLTDGTIADPDAVIRDSEGRKMPYLQAVIKESLRLAPPAAQPLPKIVPPEGDTIAGRFLHGGTEIGPERWLEADARELALMNSTVDLVFSHGKWMCLGKNVALMEFNKIFVEIFKRFDISIVDGFKPLDIVQPGLFLLKNFWIRIAHRESDDVVKFAVSATDLGLGEMVA
ncbi:cytochrome P450 [Pseudoneurospora amorphoporcata]|uniref:Cytochrome P450 n=1 Tax=Pseudoneurospora amorphoporcata TaxID=241081 RepID=A0AAN6P5Y0_9PEZI|nr:cytochrome P450 [Pseudoneurospora amorphoporcata]